MSVVSGIVARPGGARASFAICALSALCTLCAFAAPSRAAESTTDPAPRDFGGHLFIPSSLVPDPFVATSFGTTTGFGSGIDIVTPIYNPSGEKIGETSAEIGFMALEFFYTQTLHRRFALRAAFSGGGRMGTTPEAVVSEGVSAVYGYGIGGTMSLVRRSNWMLSGTADVRGNTVYGVFPLDFLRTVLRSIADGDTIGAVAEAQDTLLQKGDNSRFLGGLRVAYAPAPWLGLTAFVESGLGDGLFDESRQIGVTNVGVAASFDLNPIKGIPIGAAASFRNESLSEKGDNVGSSQSTGMSLVYTGRRFFSIGLEGTWSRLAQPSTDKKIDVVQNRLVMRYDFK